MPNGRLYDRAGMAMTGRQSLETRWVESLLVAICVCVSSLSLIDAQRTVPVPIRG
jgi:hypothetical protein